jgi:hypothetical protein
MAMSILALMAFCGQQNHKCQSTLLVAELRNNGAILRFNGGKGSYQTIHGGLVRLLGLHEAFLEGILIRLGRADDLGLVGGRSRSGSLGISHCSLCAAEGSPQNSTARKESEGGRKAAATRSRERGKLVVRRQDVEGRRICDGASRWAKLWRQ